MARRPALELTEQKRRGTGVVTLRVVTLRVVTLRVVRLRVVTPELWHQSCDTQSRDTQRGGLRKSITQWLQPNILPQESRLLKISSSTSMATLSHTQMVVRTTKISRWPPWDGLDSKFPSPRTPASDRQGLALNGRYARQFGQRGFIYRGA